MNNQHNTDQPQQPTNQTTHACKTTTNTNQHNNNINNEGNRHNHKPSLSRNHHCSHFCRTNVDTNKSQQRLYHHSSFIMRPSPSPSPLSSLSSSSPSPHSSWRSFLYLFCGLLLFSSLMFNVIYTTLHLSNNHTSRGTSSLTTILDVSTSRMDPLDEELAVQLWYHACHALQDPTDCRTKPNCHWCPYGGVLDHVAGSATSTSLSLSSKVFPCVPTQSPCHTPADVQRPDDARQTVIIRAEDLDAHAVQELQQWKLLTQTSSHWLC